MGKVQLKNITTEQRNENSKDLDIKTTLEILNIINNEDAIIADAVKQQLPMIAKTIDIIFEKIKDQGKLIYVGAGSSGRIGVLDASEILPTYGVDNKIIGCIAGGDIALRLAVEGAEDSKELAIADLKKINFNEKDVVLVIGASDRTPYCIAALEYAENIGATPLALCMTNTSEFENHALQTIAIISGAEVITGSTRMKSGTATKMVLNMISTTLMIKMGKVYDNLMIDLKATNEKLVVRCINIVKAITSMEDETKILAALKTTDFDCKTTIIMIAKSLNITDAKALLIKNNYNLRDALK